MTNVDYRGARAANAGDDFHELWALRQSLSLLDPKLNLYAVIVEGLKSEDESGKTPDTWDGVDCTFYYGDEITQKPSRIVITQFKYSSANPDQSWSVARLTHSTAKNGDNSIIRKLANAYIGIKEKYPHLNAEGNLKVQLISNQPTDKNVIDITGDSPITNFNQKNKWESAHDHNYDLFRNASGLRGEDFNSFKNVLDFSFCGSGSRFSVEENVLTTISSWTGDDARNNLDLLMRYVRQKMMPESKGEQITRQVVISWLGFSDRDALFPCPSEIKVISPLIRRKISEEIVSEIISGNQYICIHGEGGCGKSTLIQEIAGILPAQSILVIYDCYGGGRYLDSDASRHRPQEAFLQLTNDLALSLRTPLLLTRSVSNDYPRIFKKRLEKASEVIASNDKNARLVIVIDAADNSVIAANKLQNAEKSFIYDFVSIGNIPQNVCFIITTRTGRLDTLNIPEKYSRYAVQGFDKEETAAFAKLYWEDVTESWIDDFFYFSRGNPRVQKYAIDYSEMEQEKALSMLRPHGKQLEDIFKEQLQTAKRKTGYDTGFFCAGIISLPRPIPIQHLSSVLGLSEYQVRDICSDLAPGILIDSGEIRFADEDFEAFLRSESVLHVELINERIADHLWKNHEINSYASTHIASALLAANRRHVILDLINLEKEPGAISDPILRREVQSQRLRIAMKVCREANNNADAILTLLYGAEALKTDVVIRKMIIDNPDLAANFARDRSGRMILWDANEIENHGRLLFQLLAYDARQGAAISVREEHRQLRAWLKRRSDSFKEQEKERPGRRSQGWTINGNDIAAEIEAVLRIEGPRQAVEQLFSWSPKFILLRVALLLSFQMITSGEIKLIEKCLEEAKIRSPWDLFLLTPLALAGHDVELEQIEKALSILVRQDFIKLDKLKNSWDDDSITADYLEIILTACEIFLARGGEGANIIPVLEIFADRELRRNDVLFPSQTQIIDMSMRAYTIIERFNNRKPAINTYIIEPPKQPDNLTAKEANQRKRSNSENNQKLERFIGPLLGIYDIRAQAIIGEITAEQLSTSLREAIAQYHQSDYRLSADYPAIPIRTRIAISITRLIALPKINSNNLLENIMALLGSGPFLSVKDEIRIFQNLALDRSLHPRLLNEVVSLYQRVKNQRSSAEDKIEAFSNIARFLLPISPDDAEIIFKDAFKVAGEVNYEVIHEIALFTPLTTRAIESMRVEERRQVAKDLAVVVCDAGVRLDGYDHFPWENAARAITTLDFSFALAMSARWDDENIASLDTLLPPILETSLSQNAISPVQILALSPLLSEIDENFACQILDTVENGNFDNKTIIECFSREELLRFGKGTRPKITNKLVSLGKQNEKGFWIEHLIRATDFHQNDDAISNSHEKKSNNKGDGIGWDPFSNIDISRSRFTSKEEISSVINEVREAARVREKYISTTTILDQICNAIQIKDRRAFLEALSNIDDRHTSGYDVGRILIKCADNWAASPSVSSWFSDRLLQILIERFAYFCRWPEYDKSFFPVLLNKTGLENSTICSGILSALENNVEDFDVSTIITLVGLIGQYCSSADMAIVCQRYARRLVDRIPSSDAENWSLEDIPRENPGSVARFLYALLGDFDTRIRWRSAHAIRWLARFGETEIIDEIVHLYERSAELSFRDPDSPFYWLAARLWLVITFDRIADETPQAIAKHGLWLLGTANNNEFPHVLLRAFAKSAVQKMINAEVIELSPSQKKELDQANISPVPRKKGRESYTVGFDRYSKQKGKDRKFDFNVMDTLPHWYTSALRIFANVENEEFLDAAESWIVDKWNVKNNPRRWDDEPRKRHRGSDSSYYMTHDHGSRPIIERYHTYLEWHAMWCTIGELMESKTLAIEGKDDFYGYNKLLQEECLAIPGLWLSDILTPKPLEKQLWSGPQSDVDSWVDDVGDDEFFTQLGLKREDGFLIVSSYHDTKSYGFRSTIRVNSAFVSPKTAASLMRSLQTVGSSWDYRIPPAGDELEIKLKPFILKGWLTDREQILGIEENDPLRYEVRRIECEPSKKIQELLNTSMVYDNQIFWINTGSKEIIYIYEPWGDDLSGERPGRRGYDLNVRSSGWRLSIDRAILKKLLEKIGFDLIVEIEITRSNKGDDYPSYDEEKTKESQFDRVLLFRRNGTIEGAEGRIGTWALPSA